MTHKNIVLKYDILPYGARNILDFMFLAIERSPREKFSGIRNCTSTSSRPLFLEAPFFYQPPPLLSKTL